MHRIEINRLYGKIKKRATHWFPSPYFSKRNWAMLELGLAKGRPPTKRVSSTQG
jgi:tmRNA-binding protein